MEPKGFFRSSVIFQKLPDMYKQLNALQKEVESLRRIADDKKSGE